ncbi:MAG TPA: hypothetical protein VF591_12650 [Pyrinomonadaceae bacterium]|jgi:hypothetical protein
MVLSQTAGRLDDKEIERLTGRSEVIVIAEVEKVEPTSVLQPWSGLVSSKQYVQYNVREVLKGEMSDGKIRVGFMLIEHSLTTDESQPRLSPELFREKNVHILFLNPDGRRPVTDKKASDNKQPSWLSWLSFESVDSDYGAVMSTPAVTEKIRALQAVSPSTKKKVGGVKGAPER